LSNFFDSVFGTMLVSVVSKIVFAILVLVVGALLVKFVVKLVAKSKAFSKLETSVQSFALSMLKFGLYAVLIVAIIGILGIPMASVIAALASAGLAIGLALQGALSNFAGGIMILIFKPFRIGDYIACADGEGVVSDISIIYTKILTVDNKVITVPNSTLMNNAVTNYSSEELRRVDLEFAVGYTTDFDKARTILLKVAESNDKVKTDPAPVARVVTRKDNAYVVTFRTWCDSDDYWDVYFDLMEKATAAFDACNVAGPSSKMDVIVNK